MHTEITEAGVTSQQQERPTGPPPTATRTLPGAGLSRLELTAMRRPNICDSRKPICPSCRKPVRRITTRLGSLLVTCDNGHPDPHRNKCGAKLHILGAPEDVCIVTEITPAEFERAAGSGVQVARDFYADLGMLPQRLGEER